MSDQYIRAADLRHCKKCDNYPSTYVAEYKKECYVYCYGCGEQNEPAATEQEAYRAWQNHETFTPEDEIKRLTAENKIMADALETIAMRNIDGIYSADVTAEIARQAVLKVKGTKS